MHQKVINYIIETYTASTVVTLPINVFHQILKFNPKFSSFPNFNHSNISQPTQKTCSLEDNTELKLSNNINFSSINKSMNNQIPKVTNLINRKNPNLQNNLASSNFFLPPVINIKISNNTNRDLTNNKTNEVIAVQPMTKKNITVEKVINTVDVPDSPTKEALIPTFIQNITDDDDDDEDENADSKKDHFIKINCYKPAMKADVSKSKETFIKGQTLQKNNTKTTTDGNNNIIASDSNGEENRNSDFESNLSFTGLSYYRLKKLKEQYGPEHLSSLQLSKNPKKRTSSEFPYVFTQSLNCSILNFNSFFQYLWCLYAKFTFKNSILSWLLYVSKYKSLKFKKYLKIMSKQF